MAEIGKDIDKAAGILANGGLVALPTETVYGLAGNGLSVSAVAKIFEAKNRPSFDPLILHTHGLAAAGRFVESVPLGARRLAEAFWPGPLTLLLHKQAVVPDLATSGLPTVAVRVPRHPMAMALLRRLPFPLAAPSANPFGYISPTTPAHVAGQLGDKIDYILDGGPCAVGLESTIVGFGAGQPVVHRLGGLAVDDLAAVAGPLTVAPHSTDNPKAPGMLKSHYAPAKRLLLGDVAALAQAHGVGRVGALTFQHPVAGVPADRQVALAPTGSLAQAAAALFGAMRWLDSLPVSLIVAEKAPAHGLGLAINDRLARAAA